MTKKLDCVLCLALLYSFRDIPTTLARTREVWAEQECTEAHTLDAWVEDPTGRRCSSRTDWWYVPGLRCTLDRHPKGRHRSGCCSWPNEEPP